MVLEFHTGTGWINKIGYPDHRLNSVESTENGLTLALHNYAQKGYLSLSSADS
jgi:hypothetical protein